MNIWLVILLSLVLLSQLWSTYRQIEMDQQNSAIAVIVAVVFFGTYWWLTYMAGVFTLL